MIKQYFKQTFNLLKANPYIGLVTILGTTLSIMMLMSHYIAFRSKVANITPEMNRDRMLYVKWVGIRNKETGNVYMNGFMSLKTIKECFQSLESPEAVVVTSPIQSRLASVPKSDKQKRAYILFTDDVFWKVFDFKILAGNPYAKEDFDAGINKIILGKHLANVLFNSPENAINREMQLSYVTYTVCAVVDDISPLADPTFAQAWIPYTSANLSISNDPFGITGKYKCQILARSSGDFPAIRKEVEQKVEHFNASLTGYYIDFYRQPDTRLIETWRFGAGYPTAEMHIFSTVILFAVLLIIPAINLSGFTMARMKKRVAELAIRRSFGSTRMGLIWQVLWENMFYSIAGGILGFFVSYGVLYALRDRIFTSTNYYGLDIESTAPMEVFFNLPTFIVTFLFCLLINLLSAFIPAWKVTSVPIINSLKSE